MTLADALSARGLPADAATERSKALGLLGEKGCRAAVTRLGG